MWHGGVYLLLAHICWAECASAMVHDCQLWRPVCQGREVMTPCISPLWTKTGVLQKLPANGLHISLVTHL